MVFRVFILLLIFLPCIIVGESWKNRQKQTENLWNSIRWRRTAELGQSSNNLTKNDYEKELNASISEYYAQRQAVMDRYYARQREISQKFNKKTVTTQPRFDRQLNDAILSANSTVETVTERVPETSNSTTWQESGYQKLGDCKFTENDRLVYQHNLGIGLRGPSQLDVTFQVKFDGPVVISCIEALPLNNSKAQLSWLDGGNNANFVKLRLTALENKGVSYTVKIWSLKIAAQKLIN